MCTFYRLQEANTVILEDQNERAKNSKHIFDSRAIDFGPKI